MALFRSGDFPLFRYVLVARLAGGYSAEQRQHTYFFS
jgi:hypothetical protein